MDNNKDNKKKFVVIIGTLAILLLLVGATYAYFALNVNQGNTKTNINASTTPVDNISLKKSDGDLHITLRPDDMALSTLGDYYAVTEEDKNYEKEEHMISLAELTAQGGANNTAYNCEVKITISKASEDTMVEVLKNNDAEVRLSFGDVLEDIDLESLKTANIERTGHITLINNSNDFINAYLKVTNRNDDQAYLANKTLDININTEVTKCDVIGTSKIELALRNTNTSNTLSKELRGGMFRYQGQASEVTDNYICFGTDDKQTCLDNQDKFMYRIIGVTPEGRLKVIKKEALEDTYKWWDNNDDNISWGESKVVKEINGAEFLENETYIPNGWQDKIASNNWIYGDLGITDLNAVGTEVYKIEKGQKEASWIVKSINGEGIPYINSNPDNEEYYNKTIYYKEKQGILHNVVKSKISLMYIHDYYLSVSDEANCHLYASNYTTCNTGWIHLSQNDINYPEITTISEMTMSRIGWDNWNVIYLNWSIHSSGEVWTQSLRDLIAIRPVFFLKSDIEISGSGTETDPYMIKL